jgi:hypothetical protein
MIFPDTPEARREIDRQLDPDDPALLESDRHHKIGAGQGGSGRFTAPL